MTCSSFLVIILLYWVVQLCVTGDIECACACGTACVHVFFFCVWNGLCTSCLVCFDTCVHVVLCVCVVQSTYILLCVWYGLCTYCFEYVVQSV